MIDIVINSYYELIDSIEKGKSIGMGYLDGSGQGRYYGYAFGKKGYGQQETDSEVFWAIYKKPMKKALKEILNEEN